MEPSSRITFSFPIYALGLLPGDRLAVAGGGGLMKSGIPNKCAVLSFHPHSASLSQQSSVDLPDAVVALATSGTTLHAVIGPGVKNFSSIDNKLTPHSSFAHDLRVSATQRQSAVAVSENCATLVVASDQGHVASVSLPRYEHLFSAQLHAQGITDLSISQDGSLVATTGHDRAAYLWMSDSGRIVQTLKPVMPPAMRTHIRAIRFCPPQPNIIFTAESNPSKGGWIAAWRKPSHTHITNYTPVTSFKASGDAITACAVNNAGSRVAVSSSEGHVTLLRWDGSSFTCLWSTEEKTDWIATPRPPHVLPITGIRFAESGDYFFTASADSTVAVWPIRPQTNWRRIRRLRFSLLTFLLSLCTVLTMDGRYLPGSIRYYRGRLQPHLEPHLSKLQEYVRPFFRDHPAEKQPYISEVQHATEPHQKYASERIRPYAAKTQESRMRWKSILQSTCSPPIEERRFGSSPSALSTMKDHQKIRETADDREANNEPISSNSKEDYVDWKVCEPLTRSGKAILTAEPVLDEVLQFLNPRLLRGQRKEDSNEELVPSRTKVQGLTRNRKYSGQSRCSARRKRRTFSGHEMSQEEQLSDLVHSKKVPPVRKDGAVSRRKLRTSNASENQKDEKILGEDIIRASEEFEELRDSHEPTSGKVGKDVYFRKASDGQQFESLLGENRYRYNQIGGAEDEVTYGPSEGVTQREERAEEFPEEDDDTHVDLVSFETDSQASGAGAFPKKFFTKGTSHKDRKRENAMPENCGPLDNNEVPLGIGTNMVALGKEVLSDVNRKINLILRESSYAVADEGQSELEISRSQTGSESTIMNDRDPAREST